MAQGDVGVPAADTREERVEAPTSPLTLLASGGSHLLAEGAVPHETVPASGLHRAVFWLESHSHGLH